jgi:hypothetical protein
MKNGNKSLCHKAERDYAFLLLYADKSDRQMTDEIPDNLTVMQSLNHILSQSLIYVALFYAVHYTFMLGT